MSAMTGRFQQLNTRLSGSMALWLRYAFVLTLSIWIVFKLCAIETLLQQQQHAALKNTASLSHQQTLLLTQLHRIENKLTVCERVINTHSTLDEEVKACRTQLDAMKAVLEHIQAQTTPSAMLSALKPLSLSAKPVLHPHAKKVGTRTRSKSLTHPIRHLPFQVLNIDSWNGECLVMVNHHGHIDLLSQGDTLEGWKVIDIHFDAGQVKFKHRQGQSMTLTLTD